MNATETPLTGPPPSEVPLENAPLVRVSAQIRYPSISSVAQQGSIDSIQEGLRNDYPVLLRPEETSWRFSDETGAWQVTLAPEFLALETNRYSSRDDFLGRFRQVLTELDTHINPRRVDLLRVRYIDRIVGENLHALPKLVRQEVVAADAQHRIVENRFDLPEEKGSQLWLRRGQLSARSTVDLAAVDLAAVDPVDEPSWVLALDAVRQKSGAFNVETIYSQARMLAERIYSFFRWAVTDEFLRRYGGRAVALPDARARLGRGPGHRRVKLSMLDAKAVAERAPLPPEELLDAMHDRIHHDVGRGRAARTVRTLRRVSG